MKKKTLMLLMGLVVVSSYGNVSISWDAAAGFFFNGTPGVGILGDATGHSTVAQLIYSVDLYADAAGVGGAVTGDDLVWAAITITEDGIANDAAKFDSYAMFLGDYEQGFVSGYVYARIFQDSDIGVGDWYFYTPMLTLLDRIDSPAQSLEMNTDMDNGNPIDSGPTVAQVVPEPAAIGLIGLGGIITLTASRIRRRNSR
ncbi:MAG: PEP-CTERM sorting domain-containing protein [Kiritimatiellales bacterium]